MVYTLTSTLCLSQPSRFGGSSDLGCVLHAYMSRITLPTLDVSCSTSEALRYFPLLLGGSKLDRPARSI